MSIQKKDFPFLMQDDELNVLSELSKKPWNSFYVMGGNIHENDFLEDEVYLLSCLLIDIDKIVCVEMIWEDVEVRLEAFRFCVSSHNDMTGSIFMATPPYSRWENIPGELNDTSFCREQKNISIIQDIEVEESIVFEGIWEIIRDIGILIETASKRMLLIEDDAQTNLLVTVNEKKIEEMLSQYRLVPL
jgi:hypothetical protein